ncbi:aldehyde dehydrogenase family protein [Nocardia niigatensis]|uniref:aldehyde dehydrogenase family protein n=1 Tax=Nocardia niigatensis TaxID=209249 RepID=UPI0003106EB8|nr:aldehyde dehydrogenase family protein [Nocardia niigatensis]
MSTHTHHNPHTPARDVTPEAAVARLQATFTSGKTRPLRWRLEQLTALERLLTSGEAQIAAALASDLGRPPTDTFLGDIAPTAAEARYARKRLRSWTKPARVHLPLAQFPGRAWYEYEPLGVTFLIAPWNYPIYLALGPLVAAIAAGNCAVIKPSEHAPETARVLVELVAEHLDPDAFAVLEGGPDVTRDVLAQGVDLAFFTGGPEVGKAVMAAAAPYLTPVVLELGGKCPVVVAEDANLQVAARRIAWTKLMNSGQTCVAPDYLLVADSVLADFERELATAVRDMSPNGDGGKQLPIVNSRHAARLQGLLDGHGGRILQGGRIDAEHARADLTIIESPDLGSALMTEEIFGPLLPIVPISSFDAALAYIRRGPKPLAAYVFTESGALRRRFRTAVSAGAVVANHIAMHVLTPALPFGGVGNSGMGAYHGKWGFETFSHRKANLDRPTTIDPRIVYPPYGRLAERLLRRIF